jgi:hypothetical protein
MRFRAIRDPRYTSRNGMVKRVLLLSCLILALVASGASAAPLSVPKLKPLEDTRPWFKVGDYSTVLKGIPSASPEYLRYARSKVHRLRHRLNNRVQRRDFHRRASVRRQARALRRGLKEEARAKARSQRHKAKEHYRERHREAEKIPDAERRRKKLRHARRLFTRRKLEIQRSLLGNLRQAGNRASNARAATRPRVRRLRHVDRGIARTQNRELTYQFHALRNRS